MKGDRKSMEIDYIRRTVNKMLINRRFRLNRMIDRKQKKPTEVTDEQWNRLVVIRATEQSKAKSEQMRAVSKGKGSKAAQMAAHREAAIVKLVCIIYACAVCVGPELKAHRFYVFDCAMAF